MFTAKTCHGITQQRILISPSVASFGANPSQEMLSMAPHHQSHEPRSCVVPLKKVEEGRTVNLFLPEGQESNRGSRGKVGEERIGNRIVACQPDLNSLFESSFHIVH